MDEQFTNICRHKFCCLLSALTGLRRIRDKYKYLSLKIVDQYIRDFISGQSLNDAGESFKRLAEVKYSLEENVKQNFLEPLSHLQSKDLKEVNVSNKFTSQHEKSCLTAKRCRALDQREYLMIIRG